MIVNAKTDDLEREYAKAEKEIDRIIDLIRNGIPIVVIPGTLRSE